MECKNFEKMSWEVRCGLECLRAAIGVHLLSDNSDFERKKVSLKN